MEWVRRGLKKAVSIAEKITMYVPVKNLNPVFVIDLLILAGGVAPDFVA
jgi:hypothetical protein